jgi:hypothetical protein
MFMSTHFYSIGNIDLVQAPSRSVQPFLDSTPSHKVTQSHSDWPPILAEMTAEDRAQGEMLANAFIKKAREVLLTVIAEVTQPNE